MEEKDKYFWENPFKAEDFEAAHYMAMGFKVLVMNDVVVAANARFREIVEKYGKRVYGTHDGVVWSTLLKGTGPTAILICEKKLEGK